MTTNREPLRRPRRGRISADQEQALWLGVPTDAFADEDERREAWECHCDRLMGLFATHGRRPLAWWVYDSPIPDPGYDLERSALYDAGLLGKQEREQLVAEWRSEFERAQVPGFGFCVGLRPDGRGALWLTGQAACKALYRWADVPQSLVREWTAERRATIA